MRSDMIRGVALDLILGVVFRRAVGMAFVVKIACVDLDDPAMHVTGLGIPSNVIANFKLHDSRQKSSCEGGVGPR